MFHEDKDKNAKGTVKLIGNYLREPLLKNIYVQ